MTHILAFSDLHHSRSRADVLVQESASADLVIGAGDFANHRQNVPEAMNLLFGIKKPFVVVPGNNESDQELRDAAHAGTTVLHGQFEEIAGVRVFGIGCGVPLTPWTEWSFDLTEDAARSLLANCPEVDILITHSPPKGAVDRSSGGLSLGSLAVREAIERVKPRLVLCGHVHECWGVEEMIGPSRVCNLGPTPNWFDF